MTASYCIIGTGVAAVNAAKAIRDEDKTGKIVMIGSETPLPYNRIKLSKELFSDLGSEKVLIKKEKWYEKQNIEVLTNTKIESIDFNRCELVTANGERIAYDKLLLCTGSKNRKLPIDGVDKQGVFTIREMHEAEDFKAYIHDKKSVINIGGGIQGLETAWSIHQAGKNVSIIEAAPRLMARQLDEETGLRLKTKIEEAGVKVYLNTGIQRVIGNERVEAIIAGEKSIPCESVIYSIGVIPNLDLVKGTELETNRGIIVNDKMETSIVNVFAAGDVTELNGEVACLWGVAMDQGKAAGKNMASKEAVSYEKTIPLTVFSAFNISLFSIGLVDESQCDVSIIEDEGTEKYTRVFFKDNKIVGAISLEGVAASLPYKNAIESQVSVEGIDLDAITIEELMNVVKERLTIPA